MTAPQYRAERAASSSAKPVAITVAPPRYSHRLAAWTATLPGLDMNLRADLAARYRLSNDELRVVAAMSRTGARLGARRDAERDGEVERAVAAIVHRDLDGLVRPTTPRRRAGDLVLPDTVYRRVPEIPATYRACSAISMAHLIAAVARQYHRDARLLRQSDLGEYAPLLAEVAHG